MKFKRSLFEHNTVLIIKIAYTQTIKNKQFIYLLTIPTFLKD